MDIQNTLLVTAFRDYGTAAQREAYLPRLATDTVCSFCLSEPGSGSDAFALKTRARRDGSDWVIDGGKCWISNAKEAGLFVVFANVDPAKGHRGITAFIVEKENPGLQVGKKEKKLDKKAEKAAGAMTASDADSAKYYLKVMTKATADAEFVSKETTRLQKMIGDGSVKPAKKEQFGRRLNMLSSFS